MSTNNDQSFDWINPPTDIKPTSLWESVHDGDLQSIASDVLKRKLVLILRVPHFDKLAPSTKFSFRFEGVQSVRVFRMTIWPGKFEFPDFRDRERYAERDREFRSLWRQESQAWPVFEAVVNADADAEITDGDMLQGPDAATVRFGVTMSDGEWYESFIRAERNTIYCGDELMSLEDFLSVGRKYWDAFAEKRDQRG